MAEEKLKEMRKEAKAEGKPSAIRSAGVTVYTGKKGDKKKKTEDEKPPETEKVDAAAMEAAKKAAEEQHKKNVEAQKKRKNKLSAADIAMGLR